MLVLLRKSDDLGELIEVKITL